MNIPFGDHFTLKTPFIAVLLSTLTACNNEESPLVKKDPTEIRQMNSSTTQNEGKDIGGKDSINNSLKDRFWMSSYMNTDNFSFKTGYVPIDDLKYEFDNDPKTKVSYRRDLGGGDCVFSIKSMKRNKNDVLHCMKGDCGEYGFSNDQYYFFKDSLKLFRSFNVNINTWPGEEGEASTWKVEEEVYVFSNDKVSIKKRELITDSDLLKNVLLIWKKTFVEEIVPLESLYEEKKKEALSNLEMKPFE
ncbi:MAG: hypothetical protein ACO1N0_10115 [Fluviicola sp.]